MHPKTMPTPVRFDSDTKRRVKVIARRIGSNSSSIIRLATIRLLEEIDRTGELRVQTAK